MGILNAKSKEQRVALYRDMLKVTAETMAQAEHVSEQLEHVEVADLKEALLAQAIEHGIKDVLARGERVVDQTDTFSRRCRSSWARGAPPPFC